MTWLDEQTSARSGKVTCGLDQISLSSTITRPSDSPAEQADSLAKGVLGEHSFQRKVPRGVRCHVQRLCAVSGLQPMQKLSWPQRLEVGRHGLWTSSLYWT